MLEITMFDVPVSYVGAGVGVIVGTIVGDGVTFGVEVAVAVGIGVAETGPVTKGR